MNGDTLSWQWKAGRDTKYVLAATITAIEKADTGFLGIGASPSMAGALPDAIVVSFKRLDAGTLTSIPGAFKLRMPRVELGTLSVGDSVKLDLIDDDVCVGVKLAPVTK